MLLQEGRAKQSAWSVLERRESASYAERVEGRLVRLRGCAYPMNRSPCGCLHTDVWNRELSRHGSWMNEPSLCGNRGRKRGARKAMRKRSLAGMQTQEMRADPQDLPGDDGFVPARPRPLLAPFAQGDCLSAHQ